MPLTRSQSSDKIAETDEGEQIGVERNRIYEILAQGQLLEETNDDELAEWVYRRALEEACRFKKPGPFLLAECSRKLANLLQKKGRQSESLRALTVEKAVYEAALLSVSKKVESGIEHGDFRACDLPPSLKIESNEDRAVKFEQIGRLFLERGEQEMAGKYAMKAITCKEHDRPGSFENLVDQGRLEYQKTLERIGQPKEEQNYVFDDVMEMAQASAQADRILERTREDSKKAMHDHVSSSTTILANCMLFCSVIWAGIVIAILKYY